MVRNYHNWYKNIISLLLLLLLLLFVFGAIYIYSLVFYQIYIYIVTSQCQTPQKMLIQLLPLEAQA